jgi:hypothetical protein
MNKIILGLVRIFNPLWKSMGADLKHLHAILKAKLLIDSRRKSGLFTGLQTYSDSYVQYIAMALIALFGLLMLMPMLSFQHIPTGLTIYFGVWMVFLSMTVVMDFSDVLVDPKDGYTLLPTPVNDVTLSISRILRIIIYLSKQALAFIFPALVYWFINDKLGLLVFMLQALMTLVLTVSLVTLIYLAIIKYVSSAKVKNMINNMQIVFIVVILTAYYLLPKLIDLSELENSYVYATWYSYLAPPAWIAAIWDMLINQEYNTQIFGHVVLSIVGTLGALVFISKYLSQDFGQHMFSANLAIEENKPIKNVKSKGILNIVASFFSKDMKENAAFMFCYRYLSRDRKFKLKTYPILAYVPIMIGTGFLGGEGSFMERYEEIQAGNYYVFAVYIIAFLGYTALSHALYSEMPSQTWIFRSTPIAHPKTLLYALYKVVFVKFILPAWIILFAVSVGIWGMQVIDDFLFGGLVLLFLNVLWLKVNFKSPPFSKPWSDLQNGSNFLSMFLLWILIASIVGIHYHFLADTLAYLLVAALILVAASYFIWRSFDDLTWDKVEWD